MERARPNREDLPDTRIEGTDRRTPVGPRRESGERLVEHVRYVDVENRTTGTPGFAVRTDPESGLVVFVDGRDAPAEETAHVANGIFALPKKELPLLALHDAAATGAQGTELFRPRRIRAEELLASAAEHALPMKDLLEEDADLRARNDHATALELPASAALAIVPERITADEIIGADLDTAETLVNQKTLRADDAEWKGYFGTYEADERRLRAAYEAAKAALIPLLDRAGRHLAGDKRATARAGEEDDLRMALKRGALDFLARFQDAPREEAVGVMRRKRKADYIAGIRGDDKVYERIAKLPIYSAAERAVFYRHKSAQHDWGVARMNRDDLAEGREQLHTVRAVLADLRAAPDADARLKEVLDTGTPALGSDERAVLAAACGKDGLVRDMGLLDRLYEPDLTPAEQATVAALEDVLAVRKEPVGSVMATDAFRGLSRAARFTLAERLTDRLPEPERLQLLETRAVAISGRLGNDILVYRLRNGRLETLQDAMLRRGQETLKLRGLERPVRANQTARESFNAEFGDQFVILPAEHAQLRADATLAAATDPETVLRKLADEESYPLLRITVRAPKAPAAAPALDTAAQNG